MTYQLTKDEFKTYQARPAGMVWMVKTTAVMADKQKLKKKTQLLLGSVQVAVMKSSAL